MYATSGRAFMTLTVINGKAEGIISGPGYRYSMFSNGGSESLRSLNLVEMGKASEPAPSNPRGTSAAQVLPEFSAPLPERPSPLQPNYRVDVNVLVLYTQQALNLVGGNVSAINLKAQASLDQMNQAMINSGQTLPINMTLAGVQKTDYVETGMVANETARTRFKRMKREIRNFQPAKDARTNALADLVITLVADSGDPTDSVYGVAYTNRYVCDNDDITGPSVSQCNKFPVPAGQFGLTYKDFAFGVVSLNFATQDFTFAHEAGHMLGSEHDQANGQVPFPLPPNYIAASFPFSYGSRDETHTPHISRDIMAYPYCSSGVCTPDVSLQYANPDVFFIGTTTPSGDLSGLPGGAISNNSKTLRILADIESGYFGPQEPADRLFRDSFE
jgi:hypothetical protein